MKLLAVVLQTQRFKESDLLLNILSEEQGRLSCLARGAMKSKVRFSGGIDLWDSGYFELERPRRGPPAVEGISQRERWPKLREDLKRYTFAAFASEIVLRLTEEEHEEDGVLCRMLLQTFQRLSTLENGNEQATVCIYFSLTAIRTLGYDLSENEAELAARPELRDWIRAMLADEQPIVPFDGKLLEGGFNMISTAVESILGRELKAKHAALEAVLGLISRSAAA